MSGSLLDDVARTLARPLTRRQTMRLLLAGGAALALPPLRPRLSFAQSGKVLCYQNPPNCVTIECFPQDECCVGPVEGTCPRFVGCCDACQPNANKCVGGGMCGPGESTCQKCCEKRGQGACKDKARYECCLKGEILVRGRCCSPRSRSAPTSCAKRNPNCVRKKTAEEIKGRRKCYDILPNGGRGLSAAEASFSPGGLRWLRCLGENTARWREGIEKCPRISPPQPDPGACLGECDEATRTCKECDPGRALSAGGATAESPAGAAASSRNAPEGELSRESLVPPQALRARLRAAGPRLNRTLDRLERALKVQPTADSRRQLAEAYAAHRNEVLRLRRGLAQGQGGRPQRLALATLDDLAAGLDAFRRAAIAETITETRRETARGVNAMNRAATEVVVARRALGCSKTC